MSGLSRAVVLTILLATLHYGLARELVTVCTAPYEGFDFFAFESDIPTSSAGWPVVFTQDQLIGSQARLKGFDVDLRAEMFSPARLNMEQRVLVYPTMSDALYAVRTRKCNMTHAPATITPYRESCSASCPHVSPGIPANTSVTCCIDFSHQMMVTGVSLMLKAGQGSADQSVVLDALVSKPTIEAFLLLFGLVVIAGHLFWLMERDQGGEVAHEYRQGSLDGVWWAFVTATTVGYGDFSAKRSIGRLFAVFWMIVGLIVTGIVLGILSSALTAAKLVEPVQGLAQMRGKSVCTGEFYSSLLTPDLGIVHVLGSFSECLDKLKAGDITALATDAPVIQYDLKHQGTGELGFEMTPFVSPVSLGIAFPEGSHAINTLLSRVNPVLLELMSDTNLYARLQEPWFGAAPTTTDEEPSEWNVPLVVSCLSAIVLFVIVQFILYYRQRKATRAPVTGETKDWQANPMDNKARMSIEMTGGASSGGEIAALQAEMASMRRMLQALHSDVATLVRNSAAPSE